MKGRQTRAARLLREARSRAGLTQEQLAIRAGTKQPAISRIESGEEEPTLSRLLELLWVMGFDLGDELVRRPIPGDAGVILRYRTMPLEQRGDAASEWNEFAGELTEAGRRLREQELRRLVEQG